MLLKQERTKLWAGTAVCVTLLLAVLCTGLTAKAANLPYTYWFEPEDEAIKMFIEFEDKDYLVADYFAGKKNEIHVKQNGKGEGLPLIEKVVVENPTIEIEFRNLDLLDNKEKDFILHIPENTVRPDQTEAFELPLNIFDITPGFYSTFIVADADAINDVVFKYNAPRDINVHIPKAYITDIETIHRYEGLVPKEKSSPNLTNIDVLTEKDVGRLKVALTDEVNRDLIWHNDLKGFTIGYAGLEAGDEIDVDTGQEIGLQAYDKNGKFLEDRNFKLKVINTDNDFILNDYIEPIPKNIFGKTKTLYELMKDPQLLEFVISRIPVSQLNRLGITYEYQGTTVEADSEERLLMALANKNFERIMLSGDIKLNNPLCIDRDVEIIGMGKKRIETSNQPVTLGRGKNIKVTLRNIEIIGDGDLTIDVGEEGIVVLDNVCVTEIEIIGDNDNCQIIIITEQP
jgi:hypothetical protein